MYLLLIVVRFEVQMQFYIYKFDKIRGGAFVMYQIAFSPWDEK